MERWFLSLLKTRFPMNKVEPPFTRRLVCFKEEKGFLFAQREEIRREDLSKQLNDRKFKALTISSELTEYSMRSSVEENLSDTTLRTSTKSSYYLPVDSVEED